MIALLLAAITAQSPTFPDLLGHCEIIDAQDEARRITGMPYVAHLPGLDDMCREAFEAVNKSWNGQRN